jgi:hypothetical protein
MPSFVNHATFVDSTADDDTCSVSSSFTEPSSISSGNTSSSSSSSSKDSGSKQPTNTADYTSDDSVDDDVDSRDDDVDSRDDDVDSRDDDTDSRDDDTDSAGSLRAFVLNDDEYCSSEKVTEDEDGEEEVDWRGMVVAHVDAHGYHPLPGYEHRRLRPAVSFKVREIHTEKIPEVLPTSGATGYCPTRRRMHLARECSRCNQGILPDQFPCIFEMEAI